MSSFQDQLKEIERQKQVHKQTFSRYYRLYFKYSLCQAAFLGIALIVAGIISVIVYVNKKHPVSIGETIWYIITCLWYSALAVGFLYGTIFEFLTSLLFKSFKIREKEYSEFNKERANFSKRAATLKKSIKEEKAIKLMIVPIKIDDSQDALSLTEQLKKVDTNLSVAYKTWPNYKRIEKIKEQEFNYMLALGFLVNLIIATSILYNSNQEHNFGKIAIAVFFCFLPGYIPAIIFGLILYNPFLFIVKFLLGIPHNSYVGLKKFIENLESQKRSIELKIEKEQQSISDRIAYQKRQQELSSQRQFETIFLGKVETFLDDLQKKKYSASDATIIRNSIQDDYVQIKKTGFQNHTQVYYTNRLDKIDALIHGEVPQKGPESTSTQPKSSLNSTQNLDQNKTKEKNTKSVSYPTNFVPTPIKSKPYIPGEKQEENPKTVDTPKTTEEKKIPVIENKSTLEIKIAPTKPKTIIPSNKEKPIPKEEEKTSSELFGSSITEETKQESAKTYQPKQPVKIDFPKLNEYRHNIGELGELYILEKEQNHLISQGKIELSKGIIHVSINSDSEGYDIVSFTNTGDRKYIEVKTTTGNEFEPFYLSTSEIEAMKLLNNYWIYRVYNFNIDLKKGDLYKIDCKKELNRHYDIQPSSFKVTPKR